MNKSNKRPSLSRRVLLISNLGLLLALTVVGWVMDQAFKEKTLHIVKERLESYVEALLPEIEWQQDQWYFPELMPTPRLNQPGSGMYAAILTDQLVWESPSAIGQSLPEYTPLPTNERQFDTPLIFNNERLFRLSQGVEIESENGTQSLTLVLTEHAGNFYRELGEFEETLLTWLIGVSVFWLLMQWWLMTWTMKPLHQLTIDLTQLESGSEALFSEKYPEELTGLTSSLNRLLANERSQLERQRNTLGDLAHSLKTPLAVIQSELGNEPNDKAVIQQQLDNMDEIVAYQLKKAAVAGHRTFTVGVPVIDVLDKIAQTLQKINQHQQIKLSLNVAPGAVFYGEKGDLLELLGNLLENAFKWCDQQIHVTVKTLLMPGRKRSGLVVTIADDGPGIAPERRLALLQRGVRGDEQVTGHGIGLSIVADIVDSYQGSIEIGQDEALQGAVFKIMLPP